jgi:hypothetical protein
MSPWREDEDFVVYSSATIEYLGHEPRIWTTPIDLPLSKEGQRLEEQPSDRENDTSP